MALLEEYWPNLDSECRRLEIQGKEHVAIITARKLTAACI